MWKMSGKETAGFPGTLVTDGNVQVIVQVVDRLPRGFQLSHRWRCKNQSSSDHSPSCPFQCSSEGLYSKCRAEILELYFPFCLMLSLWAGSVDNGDDDLEVSGIHFSAFYWCIQIQDPKGSFLFLSSASRSGFRFHCLWCLGGEYWPHRSQRRAMLMLSVVYTLCQMYYGIMFYSLSRVLSLLSLCVKRQCATAARTAVNYFSWAILPRIVLIDILMSLHPFPLSGPPASKTDFLPTIGFLSCIFHNYSLTQ